MNMLFESSETRACAAASTGMTIITTAIAGASG